VAARLVAAQPPCVSGTARFLMFSKRIHLVLEVAEEPTSIRFRDRCGASFAQYEGLWQVHDQEKGAAITYELAANDFRPEEPSMTANTRSILVPTAYSVSSEHAVD
jgi:hypothetical protein